MPNWATNTVRFEADEATVAKIASAVTENGTFDFNVFLPCPEDLAATTSPVQVVATQQEADAINEEKPSWLFDADAIRAISEDEASRRLNLFGHTDWYGWKTANWGTKWEGCEASILQQDATSVTITFQTAWAAPHGIFAHLTCEGVKIFGGTIHEDGDEFELHGDIVDFERYFHVVEETYTEEVEDEEDYAYEWISRSILLKD